MNNADRGERGGGEARPVVAPALPLPHPPPVGTSSTSRDPPPIHLSFLYMLPPSPPPPPIHAPPPSRLFFSFVLAFSTPTPPQKKYKTKFPKHPSLFFTRPFGGARTLHRGERTCAGRGGSCERAKQCVVSAAHLPHPLDTPPRPLFVDPFRTTRPSPPPPTVRKGSPPPPPPTHRLWAVVWTRARGACPPPPPRERERERERVARVRASESECVHFGREREWGGGCRVFPFRRAGVLGGCFEGAEWWSAGVQGVPASRGLPSALTRPVPAVAPPHQPQSLCKQKHTQKRRPKMKEGREWVLSRSKNTWFGFCTHTPRPP